VTLSSWRILKARYAAQALDGEGAKKTGGRWNSPGTAVVYTSATASLGVLELLVHLGSPSVLPAYVLIECQFDSQLVTPLQRANLPANWRAYPPPPELQALGDKWVKLGDSAVLEVPSVLVPNESNFVLNPGHPDFSSIEIVQTVPFTFDMRLRQ
jgi:RES domain-containing protein